MLYRYALSIPKSTPASSPESTSFTLPAGTITKVDIDFPPGPQRLAHMAIFHNEFKLWPTNPDEYFAADDCVISFPESYELPDAWNAFRIEGWNEDTANVHEVVVHLDVQREVWTITDLMALLTGAPREVEISG